MQWAVSKSDKNLVEFKASTHSDYGTREQNKELQKILNQAQDKKRV